ncbi:VapC toxin family PIN domain ribonuclease [Leptolyngbya sp. 'hensonii']|uniref:type II toxin-antitoxin system VapC family toxin n=1 Tax=Leptolyngbya sp. 'hensonii' TaxID=1922337 RepID=UPI00094FD38E|nr:PIN domain-containing protein [Leptolyngbya sp. 'hensonii']OLP16968.1 VapC toxin family PIN domain ribonuclease [Leptolyngbya sp. 'hensonii']
MVISGDRAIFVDTNVLIYANVVSAPYHQLAIDTLQNLYNAEIELWLSRQILREFIATLTRPQTFINVQAPAVIIERIESFQDGFQIAEDGAQVTTGLLDLLQTSPMGGRQIHDANIVATMLTAGVDRLLTHNVGDFQRFSELITIVPLIETP